MVDVNQKNDSEIIYGWDDGSIFFTDSNDNEHLVNSEKELMQEIIELCKKYFEKPEVNNGN